MFGCERRTKIGLIEYLNATVYGTGETGKETAPSCQVNRAIIAGVLSFEGKKRENPFVGKGSKCIKSPQ